MLDLKIGRIVLGLLAGLVMSEGLMAQNVDSVEGDRQALVDLYHATGGDNWKNNSGWLSGNPSDDWYGVQVDGNGRVIQIKLDGTGFGQRGVWGGNNLEGKLPESIGNLSKVTYFNVKHNFLEGEIPSSIGNMRSLVRLHLNGNEVEPTATNNININKFRSFSSNYRTNRFTGGIPSTIGQLTNLQFLEINGIGLSSDQVNDGSGHPGLTSIPSEIGNLKNLIGLYLNFNSISHLPSSMQHLTKLRHLYIGRNALAGTGFPEWIENLTDLRNIDVEGNQFGGGVPNLSGMKELRNIWAARSGFSGNFPGYLLDGTHPHIGMIEMAWNNLSGSFPSIQEPNNLSAFTIDGNNLSGSIPSSWGTNAAQKMSNFGVGWNELEGEFPDMSHASRLRYIRARDNNFTGPLPALHTDNSRLANLWFQNNNFSGPVDPSIAEAVKNGRDSFGDFNISGNRFCDEDIEGLIDDINSLSNGLTFRYGSQSDPICGGSGNRTGLFDTDEPGKTPEPLSPANSMEGVSQMPDFEWSDVGADYYILHYSSTRSPEYSVDVTVKYNSFSINEPLEPETAYQWRVRGVKDGVEGEWSDVQTFETGNGEDVVFLPAPKPVSPLNNGGTYGHQPLFEWTEVEDADYYILHSNKVNPGEMVIVEEVDGTRYMPEEPLDLNEQYHWRVRAVTDGVMGEWSELWEFSTSEQGLSTSSGTGREGQTLQTGLHQNYPNPFNPTTQIEFTLSEVQNVSLRVYDMAGRQVAVLADGIKQAGRHTATFSAGNLASGIYFYRFITDTQVYTKKMTLVK